MEHFIIPIERHVAAGAALLDRYMPGWESRVDLDTLDIANEFHCIVGQVTGGTYMRGLDVLHNAGATTLNQNNAYTFGFNYCYFDDQSSWEPSHRDDPTALTNEWRRVIRNRRTESLENDITALRERLYANIGVGTVTLTRTDGTTVTFDNVLFDSVGPNGTNKGVVALEFNDSDRLVHVPFVSHWEVTY